MKKFFLVVSIISISISSLAQSWQDTVAHIQKFFERYKPSNPGCQLAIARNGQLIYSRAWGMADLEHNVPLTIESLIEAGSVSKQFTAACILLLEQQGKLSLNDDVHKYIPEIPDYGKPITLRQMMQHTSGLKDWGAIAAIAGWPRSTKTYNNDDALYIISRQKTLNHEPGAEYLYSNSNYNLFAIIIQRVSGMSLADFSRTNLFGPAGMKHTEWRDNFRKVVPNRAIAYVKSGSSYLTTMPNEYVYGNGGLLTTAEDLIAWVNYYQNGKLGSPSLLPNQLATTALTTGRMNRYAAGLFIDSVRGWKMVSHDGATAGYRCNLDYLPDLGLAIAWISNTSEFDGGANAADAVRKIMVKDLSTPRKTEPVSYTISTEKLSSYYGWYRYPLTNSAVKFTKDGKLQNSITGTLVAVSENVFMLGSNRIEMMPGMLRFHTASTTTDFQTVDSAGTDPKTLEEYVGEYYSDEAEARLKVLLKDGKLIAQQDPKTKFPLTPTFKDGFNSPAGSLYFERGKKNRISALKIYVGRARNVEFKKVD